MEAEEKPPSPTSANLATANPDRTDQQMRKIVARGRRSGLKMTILYLDCGLFEAARPRCRLRRVKCSRVPERVPRKLFRSGCDSTLIRRFSHDFVPRARRQTSERSGFSSNNGAGEGVK